MTDVSRRRALRTAVIASTLFAAGSAAETAPSTLPPARTSEHKPVPLAFNPKSLRGLSDKLVTSHWQNNYVGAVKALHATRDKLRSLLGTSDPPYFYNDLKREHLVRTGSVVLHELYFANLGGDGKAPADARTRFSQAIGSFDAW
jgi:Fe-Mn family superoxide dismutase